MILPLLAVIAAIALWWLALDPALGVITLGNTLLNVVLYGFALCWTVFGIKELYELVTTARPSPDD
jgi:hypothetical protein